MTNPTDFPAATEYQYRETIQSMMFEYLFACTRDMTLTQRDRVYAFLLPWVIGYLSPTGITMSCGNSLINGWCRQVDSIVLQVKESD